MAKFANSFHPDQRNIPDIFLSCGGFEKTKQCWSFHLYFDGCFQKIWVPQNGQFIMDNPIKMDDLGVPLFLETSTFFGG